MSVLLEARGSPACACLPPRPSPCGPQVVPSCRVSAESQSSDDSAASMTCPPRLQVTCCVGDSDTPSPSCLCRVSPVMESVISPRSPVRPRAQCSRRTVVGDKGRKCRHTSCQSVAAVDIVAKPPTPVNVIDVLHRDQRTVCVSESDGLQCGDFEWSPFRTRCNLRVQFSLQRFCSAVLCGLLLLSALRPQFGMAAPVSGASHLNPCGPASKDLGDSDATKADVDVVLQSLRTQTDLLLANNAILRNKYCKYIFFLENGCPNGSDAPDYGSLDVGPFRMKQIPKKLGERVEEDHFVSKAPVDEALQMAHHNFQAYSIALKKLLDNRISEEQNVFKEFISFHSNLLKLLCDLQVLLKLRSVEKPEDVDERDTAPLPKDATYLKMTHWGLLTEAMNGVEYFSELVDHLYPRQESTKL